MTWGWNHEPPWNYETLDSANPPLVPFWRANGLAMSLVLLWDPLACLWPQGMAEVRYRVVQLVNNEEIGALDSSTWAGGINRFGDVTGFYTMDMGTNAVAYPYPYESRPFIYRDETGFLSLVETNTPFFGFASGINDHGQVAFWGSFDNVRYYAYRHTVGVGNECLGSFGDGAGDVAVEINNRGDVVGRSDVYDGVHGWEFPFLYTDATGIMQLEGPTENFEGGVVDINDLGHIVVSGYDSITYLYLPEDGFPPLRFRMVPIAYGSALAYALNNQDVVVGDDWDEEGWVRAFILYPNGTRRFVTPAGMTARAFDINDHNVVVGGKSQIGVVNQGFIWTERDGLMWLNDHIEPGWSVTWPIGINESGQIAIDGFRPGSRSIAVRLDPIPPKLTIQRSPPHLLVSWSPAWPGLVLEATDSLSTPSWQAVETRGTNVVRVALDSPQRYFRLNLDGARGMCCAPQ
jgi:uncharacterized membrane protein